MPKTNDAGIALIEQFEGERLRSYPDPGTGGDPWTIGFGHTAGVHPGESITHEQAVAFLKADVARAESVVADEVHVVLTPNQFAALVSFEYNTGSLGTSNLLACVNREDWVGAAHQFGRWVYAGGNPLPGLVRRREAEKQLFLKGLSL